MRLGPTRQSSCANKGDLVIVGIGQYERLIRLAAPERHREQQIVIVHATVAAVIEGGEVLDEFDSALAEDAEVKQGAA